MNHTVVVLVGSVHRGVLEALAYAKSLHAEPAARGDHRLRRRGAGAHRAGVDASAQIDVPLEIVHSPYRELTRPILRFIDELDARYENDIITVVLPEFVVGIVVEPAPPQPERAVPEGPACCSARAPS